MLIETQPSPFRHRTRSCLLVSFSVSHRQLHSVTNRGDCRLNGVCVQMELIPGTHSTPPERTHSIAEALLILWVLYYHHRTPLHHTVSDLLHVIETF